MRRGRVTHVETGLGVSGAGDVVEGVCAIGGRRNVEAGRAMVAGAGVVHILVIAVGVTCAETRGARKRLRLLRLKSASRMT